MKIRELLTDESKWTQGAFARDAQGLATEVNEGVCWCLLGALFKCYQSPNSYRDTHDKLIERLDYDGIGAFNDSSTTTFTDIQRVIKELDI